MDFSNFLLLVSAAISVYFYVEAVPTEAQYDGAKWTDEALEKKRQRKKKKARSSAEVNTESIPEESLDDILLLSALSNRQQETKFPTDPKELPDKAASEDKHVQTAMTLDSISELESEITRLSQQLEQFKAEASLSSNVTTERDVLRETNRAMTEAIVDAQQKLKQAFVQNTNLNQTITSLKQELTSLKDSEIQMSSLKAVNQEMQAQISDLETKNSDLVVKITGLSRMNASLEASLQAQSKEPASQIPEELLKVTKERDQLKKLYQGLLMKMVSFY